MICYSCHTMILKYNALYDHMSVNLHVCDPSFCTAYFFHDPSFSGAQKVMTLLHFPSHPPPFLLISDKSLIKNCYYYNLHTSTSVYKFKAAETKLSYVFKQMYFQVGTTCVLRSKDSSIGGCHGCHVRGQKHRNHFIKIEFYSQRMEMSLF